MSSGNAVLQSGTVTPGHIPSWTTDGIIQDSGVSLANTYANFAATITAVNFNVTNTDYPIGISLPVGYTRWRCDRIVVSGASGTLTTATVGVFTAAAAGGTAIVTTGSALTVTSGTADTNNNAQNLTIANQNTIVFSDTQIFFRVQNPQGTAASANVTVIYQLVP